MSHTKKWTDDAITAAPTQAAATSWWVGVTREAFAEKRQAEWERMRTSPYGRASVLIHGPNETTGYEKVMAQKPKAITAAYAGGQG